MSDDSFEGIPERLRQGDEHAAGELLDRFTQRLVALARGRLDSRVAQRVDADDIVQSVYRSFFVRQKEGQFEVDGWDALWGLLAKITVRKCGRQAHAQRAAKRDVRREANLDTPSGRGWEAPHRDPLPEEGVAFSEMIQMLLSELEPEKREMLVLRLQGYSVPEISAQVGRTERSVYRLLDKVKARLLQLDAEED